MSALEKLRRLKAEREAKATEAPKAEEPVQQVAQETPKEEPKVETPKVVETPVAPEPPAKTPEVEKKEEPQPEKVEAEIVEPEETETTAEEPKKRTRKTRESSSSAISIDDLKMALREVLMEMQIGGQPCSCEPTKVEEVNGKILMTRRYKTSGEVQKEDTDTELISVQKFATATATVSVGLSYTKNLGNYQSAQTNVHVSLPTHIEEIEEAFKAAKKFADEKLGILLEEQGDE